MGTALPRTAGIRRSKRGSAGAAPTFLAVCLAMLVLAADLALPGTPVSAAGPLSELEAIESAFDRASEGLQARAAHAWREVPPQAGPPEVRARMAAEAARGALSEPLPGMPAGVAVEYGPVRAAVEEEPFSALPGELCLRLSATLEASLGGSDLTREVAGRACDPLMSRASQYLEGLLDEQGQDPRSVVALAVRRAFAGALRGGAQMSAREVDGLIDEALREAENALGRSLSGDLGQGEVGAPPVPRPDPEAPACAPADWLRDIDAEEFEAYVTRFFEPFSTLPFAWLLGQSAGLAKRLLEGAQRLSNGDQGPLLAWLENLTGRPALARSLLPDASALVVAAVQRLGEALQASSLSYGETLDRFGSGPSPSPAARRTGGPVGLRAQAAQVAAVFLRRPSLAAGGPLLPYLTDAVVRFTLEGWATVEVAGHPLVVRRAAPVAVHLTVASAGRLPGLPKGPTEGNGTDLRSGIPALLPFARALDFLDGARREVDRRLLAFKDAVSLRLADAAAGSLVRFALRTLESLAEGNLSQAALALFAFLERFAAAPLRDASTANFTLLGLPFRFVGDPIGQQASLEHTQGPHTFGARLRRVTNESNPFAGALGDPLSLALEIYWRYDLDPVHALLLVDPLLRTGEGALRFTLRVEAGQGLSLAFSAPRVIRRGAVLELALSDLVPGGLPVALLPSGALVRLDAGLRVEMARTTPPTLVRFVLGAFGHALLDTLENQSGREVGQQWRVEALARRFFERLLLRAADTFAGQASRFVLKASAFVALEAGSLGAPAGALFEAALTVHAPIAVWREAASAASALARASASAALSSEWNDPKTLDWLPDAVYSASGVELTLKLKGGLGALPLLGRLLSPYPAAALAQTLFLSAGALSSLAGRRDVHWVTEYGFGLEGLPRLPLPWPGARLGPFDTLEGAHLRAESLAGPRVLISEALPSPRGNDSDLEFVELYNPNPAEVLLTGWSLTDAGGRRFLLPDGARVAPGGVFLVARSALAFFKRFSAVPDVSTLTLALNDEGDQLTLWNGRGWASDSLSWGALSTFGRVPAPDHSLWRVRASAPPVSLEGSALRFTGSALDFREDDPTPGRLP